MAIVRARTPSAVFWSVLKYAFLTIGAEWFLMWQSKIWNGQEAAFRMFACVALILLFASRDDAELADT